MKVTPDILAAAYSLLKLTPPFNRWKLPEASDVKFTAGKYAVVDGEWQYDGRHSICISAKKHAHLPALLMSMAHEMAHIRQHQQNPRAGEHGTEFHRAKAAICREHGFDHGQFG